MKHFYSMLLIGLVFSSLSACQDNEMIEASPLPSSVQSYHFLNDIKPIIDKKCLACHSCYDAPCQLKMESSEGLSRGGSKTLVYDGTRVEDMSPTRLYIDAQSDQEWRGKNFYSVLSQYVNSDEERHHSIMKQMLDLGQSQPLPVNKKVPEEIKLGLARDNFCPSPGEFAEYQEKHPHGGMPLAVSGLDEKEYSMLNTWLKQGAKIENKTLKIGETEKAQIVKWENWLNQQDKRTKLVARYIYEHLFLGHLYILENKASSPTQFYQLIRSYTATGSPVKPITTVRPNDNPGKPFYYRLVAINDTIVHKTHITYRFDENRLNQYQNLFTQSEWNIHKLPGYRYQEAANPFTTFAAIPAKVRYQFLLNDAEFFVRSFIRGPVCRGQIATNVIRDQFWVMFEHPSHELYTNNPNYQAKVNKTLGVPNDNTSLLDFGDQWLSYIQDRNQYQADRQDFYQKEIPQGASLQHVWAGNDEAFLTVFRHHDSASVTKGWKGDIPLSAWLMDYPLFERTFYELVVGFNVFGNVSHQAQTRLYFDLIRNGSEMNFLRLLPPNARERVYSQWYPSAAKIKAEITYQALDKTTPSQITLKTNQPKAELLNNVLNRYPNLTGGSDFNRCTSDCKATDESALVNTINTEMQKITSTPMSELPIIQFLPEVSMVKINVTNQKSQAAETLVYSMLRNRRHSSVAFILGEELRYQEKLDTLTILPEPVGSYPNLILQLDASELGPFIQNAKAVKSQKQFNEFINQYGVRRMSPDFWDNFHSISQYIHKINPLEAGIYDMNRYGNW